MPEIAGAAAAAASALWRELIPQMSGGIMEFELLSQLYESLESLTHSYLHTS